MNPHERALAKLAEMEKRAKAPFVKIDLPAFPKALTALRAVLELHKPFQRASGEVSYFCDHCSEDLPCKPSPGWRRRWRGANEQT